jgi:hypothetical protein
MNGRNDRQEILDLLSGKKISSKPSFSGLIHITAEGLEHEGLVFHEIHKDAKKIGESRGEYFPLDGNSLRGFTIGSVRAR